MKSLIDRLNQKPAPVLPQVTFDSTANQACNQNNEAKVEANEDVPTKGGNIEKFNEI